MEEDIKNMSKEELLEYLEEISQQLDNIALDQIKIAIAELQYFKDQYKQLEEENKSKQKAYDDCYCEYKHYKQFDSILKSLVKEKIEELDKEKLKYDNDLRIYTLRDTFDFQKEVLQELLREE